MHEKKDEIRSYYNANPQKEWDRLKKKHPYEKYITIRMMDRYIKPGDRILDIGGGPGHYAIHYAKQGHGVTLLDLSDENVRFAKKKGGKQDAGTERRNPIPLQCQSAEGMGPAEEKASV